MKLINDKFNIWEEKYRPQIIDDLILPEEYKNQFKEFIKQEMLPNMLFVHLSVYPSSSSRKQLVTFLLIICQLFMGCDGSVV